MTTSVVFVGMLPLDTGKQSFPNEGDQQAVLCSDSMVPDRCAPPAGSSSDALSPQDRGFHVLAQGPDPAYWTRQPGTTASMSLKIFENGVAVYAFSDSVDMRSA